MKRNVKGITLIALVVTIIVLLILAGIAINLTIGNNGLFSRAQNAANTWEEASKKERNEISEFIDDYEKVLKELGINENNNEEDNNTLAKITGQETENIDTTDNLGNKIVVPAGFKVVNPNEDVTNGLIIEEVSTGDIGGVR